ncbi:MAG: Fe(3+)-citrate-binding protein YfmC precursor [Chloroflexi bacterium ADurb.Bin325]|nr:MAG: Fe(3+)-citrate-binding protein YfmC precursor [Chloroflexi bacterium ADurb.Bin325]
MKRSISISSLILLLALLAGCTNIPAAVEPPAAAPASGQASVVLTDQAGQEVTIAQPVRRIVSSYGMASLYVYSVGAGDRLVAATFLMSKDAQIKAHLGQLSSAAAGLPDPGGQQDANVEEIAKLDPDLILISSRAAGQETLQALGVPIIRYEGETMARLKEALTITGQALGPEAAARAAQLTAYMDERLAAIKAVSDQTPADQRKRVFISGTSPLKTAGKDMLQSEMVALAGGVNVAEEISGYWTEVNLEQVTKWDPEVIFTVPYKGASVEAILESPEWANISAVKNKQVFMLPKYLGPWDTPIPEAVLGIEWMASRLFPDTPLHDGCEARTTDFYQRFYDLAIPAEDAAALCR